MTQKSLQESVTAVVLTGGLGTRLRSVVADKPKTLAPVAGRPFLEYILTQIEKAGVKQVVLCVGYLAEQIQSNFGDKFGSLTIQYSVENALLGTAGALRFALDKVKTDTALVLNGDSFCQVNLKSFYDFHHANGSRASLVATEVADTMRYGRVNINANKIVESFDEKGSVTGAGFINAGIYLLDRELVAELPVGRNLSLERDFFPKLSGSSLYGFKVSDGVFIDIGTPQSLEEANAIFSGSKMTSWFGQGVEGGF